MSIRMRGTLLALALAAAPTLGRAVPVDAEPNRGTLQELTFGGPVFSSLRNPTGIRLYYYVPKDVTGQMPIVVGIHGCEGHASDMLNWLKAQADAHGFMLVLPDVNRHNGSTRPATVNGCWDNGSDDTFANATAADPASRSSSDPAGIYALVRFAGTELMCGSVACGDLDRVFAMGQSSGAMMTNVLLGLYPDVFKAGAAYMGVPYYCWHEGVGGSHPKAATGITYNSDSTLDQWGGAAGWSGACAGGSVKKTSQEWAALLPPYAGTRPRMMLWHGEADTLISYVNFGEEIEQWTTALGVAGGTAVSDIPRGTWANATSSTPGHWTKVWSRTRYGGTGGQAPVEAIHVSETAHEAANFNATIAAEAIRFFGLGDSEAPGAPTGFAAGTVGAGSAALSWTAPTDNVGVTSYVVLKEDGGTTTAIAWPSSTPYTLPGLAPNTAYSLRLAAVDQAGNVSASSDAITVTTTADTTAPTAPTSLKANSVTNSGATLAWTASTDDVGVTGYVVSRKDGTAWTQVGTPTAATLALTGLAAGGSYTYQVVATDGAGHSSEPATVTFTTTGGSSGGGGGGCGQGVPSGVALLLVAAALLVVARRRSRV